MSKGLAIGLGAVVLATCGIMAGPFSGDADAKDLEGVVLEVQYNIEEYQARPRAFRAASGKHIRVVGVEPQEAATVTDTELGRVVEVDSLPADAICPVVFKPDTKVVDGKRWPVLEGIEWGMRPVQLSSSEDRGNWVWYAYVQGAECEKIIAHKDYLGSTMAELLTLDPALKRRCLVTTGLCDATECTVPWGDPTAIPGRKIVFPHSLAGRVDINLVQASGEGVPEDRISEPVDGWGSEILEPEIVEPK